MNDLIAQEYIEEIQHLKDQESYQKKEIERLRNDNSTKQEQIDRNRERLVAINTEIKERKENFEAIERKIGKDQGDKPTKKPQNDQMKLGLETEEQTLKIIEKLNFVIENFKSHFENKKANFRGDNNKEEEVKDDLDHIINNKIIFNFVTIKLVNDSSLKLSQGSKEMSYQATVRFCSTTTFDQLKRFICEFWKLPKRANSDDFSEYELNDESHNQIYENDFVEKFFMQKASAAEFNQAIILIKLKNSKQTEINGAQEESPH